MSAETPPKPSPPQFLALGDRVRARLKIVEEGLVTGVGKHTHAEPDETGVCVHVQKGYFPTVRFDRTKTATIVFPEEVEKLELH